MPPLVNVGGPRLPNGLEVPTKLSLARDQIGYREHLAVAARLVGGKEANIASGVGTVSPIGGPRWAETRSAPHGASGNILCSLWGATQAREARNAILVG